MKLKKTLALAGALAIAASAVSVFSTATSAIGSDKIDFEDGDTSFIYLNTDSSDCVSSGLEVVDFNGSKQLKLDIPKNQIPKIWFDLDSIMPRDTAVQIGTIDVQLTMAPKNAGEALGWAGGTIGSAGGFDREKMQGGSAQKNPDWANGGDFTIEAYDPDVASEPVTTTKKFLLPSQKYSAAGTNPFFGVMVWANADVDRVLYIDNIVIKDGKGNALPLGVAAAAEETTAAETEAPAEETTAAVEETAAPAAEEVAEDVEIVEEVEEVEEVVEEAPVEEAAPVAEEAPAAEAAPAPVAATTSTNTGNTGVAAIAVVMAAAGLAAAISKRK